MTIDRHFEKATAIIHADHLREQGQDVVVYDCGQAPRWSVDLRVNVHPDFHPKIDWRYVTAPEPPELAPDALLEMEFEDRTALEDT